MPTYVHIRLLRVSKATLLSFVSVLFVGAFLSGSVPQGSAGTSAPTDKNGNGQPQMEAEVHAVAPRPVATAAKRRSGFSIKPIKKPYLAQLTQSENSLLPIVQQKDIKAHQQELANTVLRALPSGCRDNLKNFFVQYENVTNRGLGGKTTIIVDGTAPDNEFMALLVHECGHVIHSNAMGTQSAGASAYKDGNDLFYNDSPILGFFAISWSTENVLKKGTTKNDFISGYAQSDAFEDFAETFAMYVLHRDSFEARAKTNPAMAAKLEWMKTNLPLDKNTLASKDLYVWNKTVPWDVTKLAYAAAGK